VKRTLLTNLLVFAALTAVIEAGGQLAYRFTHGAWLHERAGEYLQAAQDADAVFERHPYLVARPRANLRLGRDGLVISTTPRHTRVTAAAPPRAGAITVAAIGGSTTFGTRVTDADTWPWQLQAALGDRYAVINYGVPGYTTAENIVQMSLLVPESGARVAIFYEGWNDIRNYHWPGLSPDYYAHGMTQFDTLLPARPDRASLLERAARYSFVLRLVGYAAGVPVGAIEKPTSGEPDPEVDRLYARNLRTLKALSSRFGMTALFVPQVLNDEALARAGTRAGWTPYVTSAALPTLMRGFNGLMANVCGQNDPSCVFVDEPLRSAWNNDDFVDEGHLSRSGGAKLAAILARRIQSLGLAPATVDSN
jgi:lysophospholipase L1-like esterase